MESLLEDPRPSDDDVDEIMEYMCIVNHSPGSLVSQVSYADVTLDVCSKC